MGLIFALMVGGVVGWVASIIMKTNAQQGILLNVLIGVVGGVLGTWLFGDVLRIGSPVYVGSANILGLLWALVGSCLFIGVLKLANVLK